MSERGFIAIARSNIDHPIVGACRPFSAYEAWHWMLLEAAFKPRRIRVGSSAVDIQRGQFVHSERFLASKWGWSKSRVHRFLTRLETEAMVSRKADHETNLITICKYEEYQKSRTTNEPPSEPQSGPAADQQRTKEEEGNKGIKEEIKKEPSLRSGEFALVPNAPRETKSKSKRAKARTLLPDGWQPTERDEAYAVSRGFTGDQIAAMGAAFTNHHLAKATQSADWAASWRTWCDNEIKFGSRSSGNGPGRSRALQDDSKSVSRAIERQTGALTISPRPRLVSDESQGDLRLLPTGRSAGP